MPTTRLGRAALLAFGVSVSAAPGCGAVTTPSDAATDAHDSGGIPVYGGPDVGPPDVGVDAAGNPDAGAQPPYGAPPPDDGGPPTPDDAGTDTGGLAGAYGAPPQP